MTEHDVSVRDFLGLCVTMMRKHGGGESESQPHYLGPMDLVLQEGETFTVAPYDSERWSFVGTPRECFKDAFELAAYHSELTYVEGYASRMIPGVHHAWCVDQDGNVVDATWGDEPGDEYVGVRFPFEFVLDVLDQKGSYGVLDHEPLWLAPLPPFERVR